MSAPDLIGRHEEVARIRSAVEDAQRGVGRVLLVAGEAGVGKTRLAEEGLGGGAVRILAGRARQDATPPYGPIAGVLRECLRQSPDAANDCGPLAPYLAALLPELGPRPEQDQPELLTEAVLSAIVHTARRGPVAVFLDDLHWADNATLELIPLLAARIAKEPAVVVGTYRSDGLTRGHPVRRLRDELRRARQLHEVRVESLGRDHTAELLSHALGAPPSDSLVEVVHSRTQGIPLYVEELAGALRSRGRLEDRPDGVALISGESVPVPETIRDAVMLRLDGLSEAARVSLDVAAVVGAEFDLELVAGLSEGEDGIGELLEEQLLVESTHGRGAFRHTLIRDAIRDEIAWSKRRSLNRRIAVYLERAGAPPENVAEHWLAAHEYQPARRALLDLAERSCRLHAYRDAMRAGHRALEIWPEGEQEDERLAALEQVAHCAQVSGQLANATRALQEVADSPKVNADPARLARTMRALATVQGLSGFWEHAVTSRTRAAQSFEAAGEASEATLEWLAVAGRHTATSALDRALDAVHKAHALAAHAGRQDMLIRAKGFEGNILAMMGKADAGRDLAQEALSIALESQEKDVAAEAYRRLASVLDYNSDFAGSRDAYATAVDYCHAQGDDANARICLGCMSFIVYRTGEWKRALEISQEVLRDEKSALGSSSVAHGITGLIRALRGETRTARKFLDEALSLAERGDVALMKLVSYFGLALVAEFEGDVPVATRRHDQVLEGWRGTQDRHDMVPVFVWQASFFADLGDEAATAQRADALSSMASQTGNPETMAALAHALAELASLANRPEEAVTHFQQALAQAEKLEIPLEHALTLWRLGGALRRVGDEPAAARHLAGAYRLTRNLGARPLGARIQAELEALGERVEEGSHPDEAALASRGGLTRRQMEITRLLAEGLTNKEIAQKLFLSPRTIDMHVGNILERLDCRSRTEAARKAAELGLLG